MRRTAATTVLLLTLLPVAGCGGSSTPYSAPATAPSSAAAGATTPAAAGSGGLIIASFAYDPNPLTVTPGQVVSVTNRDGSTHTATSDTAGAFDSGDASKGAPVTFTAPTKPGTYTFHCAYHASMHGSLVVR
jgi:plastocyanin